ncbi:sushi domain-containing protein 4-like isoform X1 [Leptonychotes weddellii]|uniref:Sushi domain-containing protein 4-like isoform X1 n=1 Tax=Leptonychotes weddellii TaxID=9713 RepID=A0A7F8RFK1_LEPWE|nr:sushi domain-containing protein 4-like isoform X1 [Leptonychotes weddellii]
MHHGMNPSPGDGFLQQQQPPPPQPPQPPPPRRLLAAVLGIQLALCFGPAQLTGALLTCGRKVFKASPSVLGGGWRRDRTSERWCSRVLSSEKNDALCKSVGTNSCRPPISDKILPI